MACTVYAFEDEEQQVGVFVVVRLYVQGFKPAYVAVACVTAETTGLVPVTV